MNIYRHVLCYDGITPEFIFPWNPWYSCTYKRIGLHLQLDVMAPVRNGIPPSYQPAVIANYILALIRTCRQIYEEAKHIFWAENAFIFRDQDRLNAFTHQMSAKPFELIRAFGIENTINAEWYKKFRLVDGIPWFANIRIPPLLEARHRHGWVTESEVYDTQGYHWIPDDISPSDKEAILNKSRCKTTYSRLTLPPTGEVKVVKGYFQGHR